MTGDIGSKRKKPTLHNSVIIVLIIVMLIPSFISMVILYQMRTVQKQMIQLQSQVNTIEDDLKTGKMTQGQDYEMQSALDSPIDEQDELLSLNIDYNESQLEIKDIEVNGGAWTDSSEIRRVYLTFDDGPSTYTDKILDILNEYGVKATFFVVGKEGYNEQYQRIVKEGHTLGMHSFSHKFQEIYQSVDSYKYDLNRLHDFLFEVAGVNCDIVRFPGGSSNKASKVDMHDLISYLNDENLTYYDWNVSSGDASGVYLSADQIADNVLNNVWKYDSVIVLMHDSSAKYTTVEALPIIIEKILESENTVLLPISEDTLPIQHIKAECQ